jgi:hypothetical protein
MNRRTLLRLAGAMPLMPFTLPNSATGASALMALALAIIAGGGPPAFTGIPGHAPDLSVACRQAGAISKAIAELRKLVPESTPHLSESNFFESGWQQSFWGANYPRLQAVKTTYDPSGLFFVHHGIGSEVWSDDSFIWLDGAERLRARRA